MNESGMFQSIYGSPLLAGRTPADTKAALARLVKCKLLKVKGVYSFANGHTLGSVCSAAHLLTGRPDPAAVST